MARIIGLDLGTYAVKAAVLDAGFRESAVTHFAAAPVPQDFGSDVPRPLVERMSEALGLLVEHSDLPVDGDAVVFTAVPGPEALVHRVRVPFSDRRKVLMTLPFELEDQVPFGLDEFVWDPLLVHSDAQGSELLVGMTRRSFLAALLGALQQRGLDPRSVTIPALTWQALYEQGLLEAAPSTGPEGSGAVEAVLDIGHGSTDLLILEAERPRMARSFPIAGLALTRAIAAEEGVDLAKAEAMKHACSVLLTQGVDAETARIAGHLLRALGALARGLRQSFKAWEAETRRPIRRVSLTGGTARLQGLESFLARELGCEVVHLEPRPKGGLDFGTTAEAASDPANAQALALAVASQSRRPRIELRKGELAFKGDMSFLRGNLSRLAFMASVVLILLGLNVFTSFHALAVQEEQVDQAMCDLTSRILGECVPFADDAISRIRGMRSSGASVPRVGAAEILAAMTQRLSTVQGVELTELDITKTKVRLQGEASSFETVAKVVDALRGYSCFGEVNQGQTRQARKSEKIEFNIEATLAEECALK